MKSKQIAFLFLGAALASLLAGIAFGVIGGLQYVLPGFLKDYLSFNKTRPIHVTLVVTWIFTGAVAGMYYYLPRLEGGKLYPVRLAQVHFVVFILTGLVILGMYVMGNFGGREYLEFPPVLAFPMLLTWILFMINFFKSINKKIKEWPVYIWMWSTGLLFFFITFCEAYLWTLPFFRDNTIRDVTVQWKAMGAMVGSWNMFVYGTGFYVMEQISGNKKIASSKITFFFYFLGLTNLMFNWGHHTYIVPAAPWIKDVSYIISMTELLILGNIVWSWQKSITRTRKYFHLISYRFFAAADSWIFLNLLLAIVISVPAINRFTHGTHITVAHAMGATIGINTMILFASVFFIASSASLPVNTKRVRTGFWVTNVSLFFFWLSLIGSGIVKAIENDKGSAFQQMMLKLSPWFHAFTIAGIGVLAGILLITYPLVITFLKNSFSEKKAAKKIVV